MTNYFPVNIKLYLFCIPLALFFISTTAFAKCTSGNCIDGRGTKKYSSGNTYTGRFKNGKRNGEGIFTFAQGHRYIGEYVNGKMHGIGTFIFKSGEKYEGQYENNIRNGIGVFTWVNGTFYTGEYSNGKKNGRGKLTLPDGTTINGSWTNDRLVEKSQPKIGETKKFSLTVMSTPYNATITFTDSKITYKPGVKLTPGRYQINISHNQYITKSEFIDIDSENVEINVFLQIANQFEQPQSETDSSVLKIDSKNLFAKVSTEESEKLQSLTNQRIQVALEESKNSSKLSIVEQIRQEINLLKESQDNKSSLISLIEIPSHPSSLRKNALVIGNSYYPVLGTLKNPENDARDMADTLRGLGFNVIIKLNANQEETESSIAEFGDRLKEGGLGLFYFAGHGLQHNKNNYLVPTHSRIRSQKDIRYRAIDLNLLLDEVELSNNGKNIIIIDACRNNPLPQTGNRQLYTGLTRTDPPKGTLLAFATSPGSIAIDGTGRNGVYTKHLLHNLNTPNLPLKTLFNRILQGVMQETNRLQIPWMTSSFDSTFYFNLENQVGLPTMLAIN